MWGWCTTTFALKAREAGEWDLGGVGLKKEEEGGEEDEDAGIRAEGGFRGLTLLMRSPRR